MYVGVDRSRQMIAQAFAPSGIAAYALADADRGLPLATASCAMVFVVDVLHHLVEYPAFFSDVARILDRGGTFLAVTDSEENVRRHSLTRLFPETSALAEGHIDLDGTFLAKLAAKCSSAMRLIPDEAHRRGMDRVRAASARGERWFSSYSVVTYARS
jgi:SAM-dependent methyltransferase